MLILAEDTEEERLLSIALLYPNTLTAFLYALAGCHELGGPEEVETFNKVIQEFAGKESEVCNRIIEIGER